MASSKKKKTDILSVVKFAAVGVAIGLILVYAFNHYRTDYCHDPVPDTPNIYVYSADRGYGTLNRTYCSGRGIAPADISRMITYSDIPEIASIEGVRRIYIFSDRKLDNFMKAGNNSNGFGQDDLTELSVPYDIIRNFADPSAAGAMFELTLGTPPADGTDGIALPQDWIMLNGNPSLGSRVTYNGKDYTLTGINRYDFAWLSFDESTSLYYIYDPSTYDSFIADLNAYLAEVDGTSSVSMMLECDDGATLSVQDLLISKYPSTNYLSAPFIRTFKSEFNGVFWTNLFLFIICVGMSATVIFVWITIVQRKRKAGKRSSRRR